MKDYKLLLKLDNELKDKLENISAELHCSKTQAIRTLILNYSK